MEVQWCGYTDISVQYYVPMVLVLVLFLVLHTLCVYACAHEGVHFTRYFHRTIPLKC